MKKLILAGLAAVASVVLSDARGGGVTNPAWIYRPSQGVIENNDDVGVSKGYVLNVVVRDAANRTLTIGTGVGYGSAYHSFGTDEYKLPLGGRVLDLSEPIADEEGNAWTIEEFSNACFRYLYKGADGNDVTYAPFYEIVFPRELKKSTGQVLNLTAHGFDRVVMDCPDLVESIPSWSFAAVSAGGLTVNLPSLKSLAHISFNVNSSDCSSWVLTGLETISGKPFGYSQYTGTLSLPAVRTFSANFSDTGRFNRLILGTARLTLEKVADKAYCNDNTWFYLNELAVGGAPGWVVGSEAFHISGLSRVWMLGSTPTFTDGEVAFGRNRDEKTMVFYVPETEEWATILAGATKLTDEEIAAFKTAHPDWAVPFGVVAASVFQTESPQYIGTVTEDDLATLGRAASVGVNSRSQGQYGDEIVVEANGVEVTGGTVPYGTVVTVTAKPAKNTTLVSWEGKLPDGTVPTGNTFTYTATKDLSVYARFTHAWEYDAEANPQTISDGFWTLVVRNTKDRNLTLGVNGSREDGRTSTPWAYPAVMAASMKGELDLAGPIYTKGQVGNADERWTITAIVDKAFCDDNRVTSFYSPTAGLVNFGSQVFNGATAVKNMVLDCPDATSNLAPWGWEFNKSSYTRFVLKMPKVATIGYGDNTIFNLATFADTDVSEWDLSGMKTVTARGLRAGGGTGPTGDLSLPNVETIGEDAFDGWTRISSLSLGTSGTLKSIGKMLFWNPTAKNGPAAGPTKLDFGKSWDFTVDPQAFYGEFKGSNGCADNVPISLKEVWFASKAPSVEALDNILALQEVAADGTKPVKIFAPMMEKTWKALSQTFTEDERQQALAMKAEGLRVVGIYKTAAGKRVAWLVQNPNFEYYTGLCIRIR